MRKGKNLIAAFALIVMLFTSCSRSIDSVSSDITPGSSSSTSSEISSETTSSETESSSSSSDESSSPKTDEPQEISQKDETRSLSEFPFGSVQLTDGMFKETFDYWSNFFLNVPNDNILYEFRLRTGATNIPGAQLGGWSIQLTGYEINEWISGFCYLYAITGNEAFKEKAIYLTDEWFKCFERKPNGIIWYSSHYCVKRWVTALLDCYVYLGKTDALDQMDAIYNWARRNLSFDNLFGDNGTEWYTLGEPFYKAYSITKDKKYLEYAKKWDYKEYWDLFSDINNIQPFLKKPAVGMNTYSYHIISHVNSFNSAAEAYKVTKNDYYLTSMKNLFLWLKNDQCYPAGTLGAGMEWALPINEITKDLKYSHAHAETGSTVSYTRYANSLLTLTGNSQVGDWLEKMFYNDVCAVIEPKQMGVDFVFMSYHDYNLYGGKKTVSWRDNEELSWTSGASSLPIEVTDFLKSAYYHENNNLYVNLYSSSVLNWNRNSNSIKLTQKTEYPLKNTSTFQLSLSKSEAFSMRFRMPEWADGNIEVTVNGSKVNTVINSNGWAVVNRKWNSGDTITVKFPMDLRFDRFSGSGYGSVMYGPLSMAISSTDSKIADNMDSSLISGFKKTGDNLSFAFASNPSVTMKPYYQYKKNEVYYTFISN